MKVDLYLDVIEGIIDQPFTATSAPFTKAENTRRAKITVNIPNHWITGKIEQSLPVEEFKEVDKDLP